jgi:hypothetical protein
MGGCSSTEQAPLVPAEQAVQCSGYYRPYFWNVFENDVCGLTQNMCKTDLVTWLVTQLRDFVNSNTYRFIVHLCCMCPGIYVLVSLVYNLVEKEAWELNYRSVLWVVYGIALGSVLLDYVINLRLDYLLSNKMKLSNVLGDSICIFVLLGLLFTPMLVKSSSMPDDDNSTMKVVAVNALDGFAIIALTTTNVVYNRLIENSIQWSIFEKQLYYDDEFKKSLEAGLADDKNTKSAKAVIREAFKCSKEFISVDFRHQIQRLPKDSVVKIAGLLEQTFSETKYGKVTRDFRFCLRMKMLANLLSTAFFLFYSAVYLTATNRSPVFVLFLSVLSFLNNLTSASCIRAHDVAATKMYTLYGFDIHLGVGQYTGYDHVQYYATLIASLVNVLFRISVAHKHHS